MTIKKITKKQKKVQSKNILPYAGSKPLDIARVDAKIKGYILPKNHIIFTTTTFVQQICSELFKKFNINGFRHVRLYDEGSRFELTTDAHWASHFMERGYFNYSRLDRNGSCYQSGYFLWDAWNKATPAYEIVIRDARENFDGGRGFSILRRSQEWADKFDFSASTKNNLANETFLNNIDCLDRFVDFFLLEMAGLIEKAHHSREFLPFIIDSSEEYPDTFLPTKIFEIVNNQDERKRLSTDNVQLTKRELECIYWLSLGKTVSEIALIYNISARTVEKFILSIKGKFNCRTLFQVGQIASNLKLDRLLQGTRCR